MAIRARFAAMIIAILMLVLAPPIFDQEHDYDYEHEQEHRCAEHEKDKATLGRPFLND